MNSAPLSVLKILAVAKVLPVMKQVDSAQSQTLQNDLTTRK